MTSQTTSIYTPFADGRPVRDIVEHTPALVNETWCRKLLAHTLDSLEQQYASGAPHRAITPDTLVMLANGEALLLPSIDESAASTPSLAGDLHALALVVHYAITAESPPDGPLGPRLYENYSEQLTKGLDCCLGPNRRLRPNTVDEMRTLLGIEAGAAELAPAPTLPVEDASPVQPEPFAAAAAHEIAPPPATDTPAAKDEAAIAHAADAGEARDAGLPPAPDFAAPPLVPAPAENPVPEPLATPPETVNLHETAAGAMLRKPASQDRPVADAIHPVRATEKAPVHPAPRADGAGAVPAAPQTWATTDRSSRAQRWGMLAGAAIVVLAAGSALVSYLQQSDMRDPAPLSPPAAERTPAGLDKGETVVAPPSASAPADAAAGAAADPAAAAPQEDATDAASGAPADTPAAVMAPPPADTGRAGGTVVNGTTYKLVIKPWGTVYVDGVDRGVSPPIKRLTLAPGQHTIRIVNPSFPEHIMTVDAGAKETMIIQHDFTARAE